MARGEKMIRRPSRPRRARRAAGAGPGVNSSQVHSELDHLGPLRRRPDRERAVHQRLGVDHHHVGRPERQAGQHGARARLPRVDEDVGSPQRHDIWMEPGHPGVPAVDRQEVGIEHVGPDPRHGATQGSASLQQAGGSHAASGGEVAEPLDGDGRRQARLELLPLPDEHRHRVASSGEVAHPAPQVNAVRIAQEGKVERLGGGRSRGSDGAHRLELTELAVHTAGHGRRGLRPSRSAASIWGRASPAIVPKIVPGHGPGGPRPCQRRCDDPVLSLPVRAGRRCQSGTIRGVSR